jgi:hypothetical protein
MPGSKLKAQNPLKSYIRYTTTMKKIIFSFLPFLLLMACNQGTKTENTNTDTTAASGNSNSASDTATDRVTGPMPGTVMTKDYVYYMGRQMYFWGWPLVNLHNRILVMQQVPEPGLNGGAVPVAPLGHLSMLADYITPDQRYVACPNQDVVYGSCFMLLDGGPVVLQVPDFGDRFWVIQMGNQRTDGIGGLGSMYGSKSGFYMIAKEGWKGNIPKGITKVFYSPTSVAYVLPRTFVTSDPADKEAVRAVISKLNIYPLTEYDGNVKTKDWTKIPSFPDPNKSQGGKEVSFVIPEKFFAEFPAILEEVPPLKGEEALYAQFHAVMDAVKKDSSLYPSLLKAAVDAEKELIYPLRQFKNVGVPVGNYWNTTKNGAAWGTDYLSRTAAARCNIFVNQPNETIYYNQDLDSSGKELNGTSAYTIAFSKDEIPKVKGFWSLTVYDANHFFYQNPDKIYSLGTKNKDLKFNPDGSLTLYLQHNKPEGDKAANWLPTPTAKFGLLLRAYWPEQSMVDGYVPPALVKR